MAAKAAKQQEPEVPAAAELAEVETRIFGKTVLRDAGGVPMERGHGSNFQKLRHADRSHYLTLSATAGADQIHQLAISLADLSKKLIADQRGARVSAEKAVEDAAIAEVNEINAKAEINKLNNKVAGQEAEIIALKAELTKLKSL